MCFDYDSQPPVRVIRGASISTSRGTLVAGEGNEFMAYQATSGLAGVPAVVVMPDVRGLFPFYEQLAERFAEREMDAIAIDYFGRTAGIEPRGADFDFWPHVEKTTIEGINADVAAAVAELRKSGERSVFTIGFCFGGSSSWLQAAAGHGLAGVIGFYGRPTTPRDGSPAPIQLVDRFECPLLALMGGADPSIPPEDVTAFETALREAGVENEVVTYPGAPHSFFDRSFEEHAAASADAWDRVVSFIEANS